MSGKYSVKLSTVVEEQGLRAVHTAADYDQQVLVTADINRPALQLAGFYNYFDPKRLQAIGRVESTYLETLSDAQRLKSFEDFMKFEISALVVCHGVEPFPECVAAAEKYDRNLFVTERTPPISSRI